MQTTPLDQVSILVVDDHDDTRALLQFVLLDAGALVQTVSSAERAHQALQIAVPDVVIVDLELTGRDGYWVLGAIRALNASKRVRVIAGTAHVSASERARALAAGFDGFLTKPFAPDELVTLIAALVRDPR
ncbi:MAG: response regulator [Candidatus Rokubacteria bacterium]|nr:response regulator [Candidatus Rokubacteria bacterium]